MRVGYRSVERDFGLSKLREEVGFAEAPGRTEILGERKNAIAIN
jgi:hypothetical protein